jgi:SAM-dependent methyltransferase
MAYETPHQKHLRLAAFTVGLRDMQVLEVGGCSPPMLLREYGPRTWTCFNLNPATVADFNAQAKTLTLDNVTATVKDIATLEQSEQYDRIYSLNCFEHIGDLPAAFARMYRALRFGGALYTLFGPIWSSDVGHHLCIPTDRGGLNFFDGVLEPWEHLTSTPAAIHARLEREQGKAIADRAIEYIYQDHDLNRLYEHHYLEIIRASGFTPAMIIRNKKGRPPAVPGATRTREFAMVLKKGPARLSERMLYPMKFGWAYLTSRLTAPWTG